jgi:hypothetical protein
MKNLVYRFGSLGSRIPKMENQPKETEKIDKHLVHTGAGNFGNMDAGEFKSFSKDAKLSNHLQEKIGKLKADDKDVIKEKKKKNKPITFVL